jgi:hypothetical protein
MTQKNARREFLKNASLVAAGTAALPFLDTKAMAQAPVPMTSAEIASFREATASLVRDAVLCNGNVTAGANVMRGLVAQTAALQKALVAGNYDVAFKAMAKSYDTASFSTATVTSSLSDVVAQIIPAMRAAGWAGTQEAVTNMVQLAKDPKIVIVNGKAVMEGFIPAPLPVQVAVLQNNVKNFQTYGISPYMASAEGWMNDIEIYLPTENGSEGGSNFCAYFNLILSLITIAIWTMALACLVPEPFWPILCPTIVVLANILAAIAILALIFCCC